MPQKAHNLSLVYAPPYPGSLRYLLPPHTALLLLPSSAQPEAYWYQIKLHYEQVYLHPSARANAEDKQ